MIVKQRKGFSLLTALFLIVMMSGVSALVMSLSGKMVKETTNLYQKEQATLLAKSYTELAIMSVMSNDRNGTGKCINAIDAVVKPKGATDASLTGDNGMDYRVRVRISYIGADRDISSCSAISQLGNPSAGSDELNIIVDAYVEYKDISQEDLSASPWITYHRRTLQKI